ncbi:hypothetical protein LANSK_08600 [Lactobacillus amylovorus subsp. amylovorus]|nr:hypothetical protein LAYK3_12760 [Lactobacillus amylovorus]GMM21432.1 hypothetical protein LAYK10_07380 [Lactobacillus amylovorus]
MKNAPTMIKISNVIIFAAAEILFTSLTNERPKKFMMANKIINPNASK